MKDKIELLKLSPEELLEIAESDTSSFRFSLTEDIYKIAYNKFKDADNEEQANNMRMEGIVFSLSTHNSPKIRFDALWTTTTKDGAHIKLPDPENDFSDDHFKYYKKRANETQNPILQARYSDVIWEFKREVEFAKIAISAYMNTCQIYLANGWDHELSDSLDRALSISATLKDAELVHKCASEHFVFIDKLIYLGRHRYILEILSSILRQYKAVKTIPYDKIIGICEATIAAYRVNEADSYSAQRAFLLLIENVLKMQKKDTEYKGVRLRIAESFAEEADWKKENYPNGNGVAAHFYGEAMQQYLDIGGEKDKVDELKIKLKEANSNAAQVEYKKIETKIEIPIDEIESFIEPYKKKPTREILLLISTDGRLILPYEEAEKSAVENSKKFVIHQLFAKTIIRNDITVARVDGVDDSIEYEAKKNIQLHYKLTSSAILTRIFDLILQSDADIEKDISDYLSESGIISAERLSIIDGGLRAFIKGDYLSSVHILVFQIEGIMRDMLAQTGIATFFGKKDAMQNIMFTKIIDMICSVKGFDTDFAKMVSIYLNDKMGDNLRNDIAHGLAQENVFCRENAQLLLMIIVKLANYRIVHIDADN